MAISMALVIFRNTRNEQNEKATRQLGGLFFKGE